MMVNQMTETPKAFSFFVKLPTDLQDEIWFYACRFSRVMEVRSFYVTGPVATHPGFRVPTALLHVCHRARELALKVYKHHVIADNKLIFFNESVDIVYTRSRTTDPNMDATILQQQLEVVGNNIRIQLRYLAVPLEDCPSG